MNLPEFKSLIVRHGLDGVLGITLNRPQVRNAFDETLIAELTLVFSKIVKDEAVRLVTLNGEGPIFSAGGDLNWMKKSIELDYAGNLKDTTNLTHMFHLMNTCPKPLIGCIHGAAIGGGVGLTSVCDLVLATKDTVFSLSEVRLGIVPACIGPFVIQKIGSSHARALFLSAERFNAEKALQIGLIHEVCKDLTQLKTRTQEIVSNMLECGPKAQRAAKELVLSLGIPEERAKLKNSHEYVADMLAKLRVSEEGQEGLKAFLEKRKPSWSKR